MKNKIRPGWVFALLAAALFLPLFAGQASAGIGYSSPNGECYVPTATPCTGIPSCCSLQPCNCWSDCVDINVFTDDCDLNYNKFASETYGSIRNACNTIKAREGAGWDYKCLDFVRDSGDDEGFDHNYDLWILHCCSCGSWANKGCGQGGCASNKMYQTRTCDLTGCDVTTQCADSPSCVCTPKTCQDYGAECGTWMTGCGSDTVYCGTCDTAAGEQCNNGKCECFDECAIGMKRCNGNVNQTCGQADADTCLDWVGSVDCPTGESCSNGACSPTCTDECSPTGVAECGLGGPYNGRNRTCGQYDGDPCLEWSDYTDCPYMWGCLNGICLCQNMRWSWEGGLEPDDVCVGSNATRISNCGTRVEVPGTMGCEPPVVTMTEPSKPYTRLVPFAVSWSGTGSIDCYNVQYKESLNLWADWDKCAKQTFRDFGLAASPIPVVDGRTYHFRARANHSITGIYGEWSGVKSVLVDRVEPRIWIEARGQDDEILDPTTVLPPETASAKIKVSAIDASSGTEKIRIKTWIFSDGAEIYDESICGPSGPGAQLDCTKDVSLAGGVAVMYDAEATDFAGNSNFTDIRWLTTHQLANFIESRFDCTIGSDGFVTIWVRNLKHAKDNITMELQGYPFAGFDGAGFTGGEKKHVFELNPFESKKISVKIYGNRVGEEKKLMMKASSMLNEKGGLCAGPGGCVTDSDEIEIKTEYPAEFPESGAGFFFAAALAAVAVFTFIRAGRQ